MKNGVSLLASHVKAKMLGSFKFWDLKWFSLVLLAKQAWRIWSRLNFFSSKLFKAQYFPPCSFVMASGGVCPSPTWRGLLKARYLSMEIRTRIGNGQTTAIRGTSMASEWWKILHLNPAHLEHGCPRKHSLKVQHWGAYISYLFP